MPVLSKLFRAAIEKGVRGIKGKLDKLDADEKRQLLADLRKLDDCPDGWKNKAPEKQRSIVESLRQAIARLLNPEKAKAISARNRKRRRENGKAEEYAKKIINKEKKAKYKADPMNKDTRNARRRERYDTDINFRTMCILRARLRRALGNNKSDHAMDLLGCTMEQMIVHIESQFTSGMTWDNQGKGDDEWQIDHIIPFVAFDTSNRDEQFIVCWYQNTQPLWGPDNRIKGGKYTEEGKQSLIRKYNGSSSL